MEGVREKKKDKGRGSVKGNRMINLYACYKKQNAEP